MTLREQLIITIVDKLLIAGILLFAGWGFNRLLEGLKSALALRNDFAKVRDAKELEFIDKQLSQFYYPLYIRLQIDGAVWDRILDKRNGDDDLRRKVGDSIERNVILPNHEEMVKIIQSSINLAELDPTALDLMLRYVRHVAVYKAMREAGCHDKDPVMLNEPWPAELLPVIERTTVQLQTRYDSLVREYLQPARDVVREAVPGPGGGGHLIP